MNGIRDKLIVAAIIGGVGFTLVTVIANSVGIARIEVAVISISSAHASYDRRIGRLERQ